MERPDDIAANPSVMIASRLALIRSKWLERLETPLGQLGQNVLWSAAGVAVERVCSLIQAVYIARLLGIELFGMYGLLFTTVGLVSSLAGLQLGLTASVNVARYRLLEPGRAAAITRLCEIVSLTLASLAGLAIVSAPETAARWLLGGAQHSDVVAAGVVIAVFSVLSGVQEGVLQGFEAFSKLSFVRVVMALAGLALVFVMAHPGDLTSVVVAVSIATVVRTVALIALKERLASQMGFATSGEMLWRQRRIIFDFSLPSVLATLIGGSAAWYGMFLLSSSSGGFGDTAVVTAAQQWRGVVLYLAAVLSSVAIPTISRLHGLGDTHGVARVHKLSIIANLAASILIVAVIGLASRTILAAYGGAFVAGAVPFWIIIATTVPTIYGNVAMQLLVGQGRMWEQVGYYLLQSVPLALGYYFFTPLYGVMGYAIWTAVMSVIVCVVLACRVRVAVDPPNEGL